MKNYIAQCISSGFYSGYLPFAPGTWGTIAICILIFPFLFKIETGKIALLLLFILIAGIWSCMQILPMIQDADPSWIVVDEWIGMLCGLLILKILLGQLNPVSMLLVFVLFRVFDIFKFSMLIRFADNLSHHPQLWLQTTGIILDDVIAGIYSGLISWLCIKGLKLSGISIF